MKALEAQRKQMLKNYSSVDLLLNDKGLTEIPEDIDKLAEVTRLCLSNNQLKNFGTGKINNLKSLQILELERNLFEHFPASIFNLRLLVALDFSKNSLTSIPPEIGNLVCLECLNLSENDISELPKEIGELFNLVELRLSKNKLSFLPPEICNLSRLEILYLNDNQLCFIFSSKYAKLAQLKELYLNNNKLRAIPHQLGLIPNLKVLHVGNNNFPFDYTEFDRFSSDSFIYYLGLVHKTRECAFTYVLMSQLLFRTVMSDYRNSSHYSLSVDERNLNAIIIRYIILLFQDEEDDWYTCGVNFLYDD